MPDRIDTWAREMSLKVMGSESRSVTIDLVRDGSGAGAAAPVASASSSISPQTDVPAVENGDRRETMRPHCSAAIAASERHWWLRVVILLTTASLPKSSSQNSSSTSRLALASMTCGQGTADPPIRGTNGTNEPVISWLVKGPMGLLAWLRIRARPSYVLRTYDICTCTYMLRYRNSSWTPLKGTPSFPMLQKIIGQSSPFVALMPGLRGITTILRKKSVPCRTSDGTANLFAFLRSTDTQMEQ